MKKTCKRILAAALASVLIWNTCEWQPHALAGSSVRYIEEVQALPEKILHQEVPYGTKYKELELPDKLKMRVWTEAEKEQEEDGSRSDMATPSQMEKLETASPSEADDSSKEASPSEADDSSQKASPSEADDTYEGKDWKEVRVRWVLDETFSEAEKYDGKTPGVYVFDAELKNNRYELDTGFLPRIEVTVLPEEIALMALPNSEPYDLSESGKLVINDNNVNEFQGRTITGSYHPQERPSDYQTAAGGIVIDNVEVDLTIDDVTIDYDRSVNWDFAGILLKGNAVLNLTLSGENEVSGLDQGAGIEVEENARLVITEKSDEGSLTATGGIAGGAGIGGKGGAIRQVAGEESYKTGTIVIHEGTITANGGGYQLSQIQNTGAGIGTGFYGRGGTIIIDGGEIFARGGVGFKSQDAGAAIGGGSAGYVDKIQIGKKGGEGPQITAISGLSDWAAAIGTGCNAFKGQILSCGTIQILSGTITATGNIGYGDTELSTFSGGSVEIESDVRLKLTEGTIIPRGNNDFGKKTLNLTVYDETLSDGSYDAVVRLYKKGEESGTPLAESNVNVEISGHTGTLRIVEWLSLDGEASIEMEIDASEKDVMETGTAVLEKGKDETLYVTLGKSSNLYKKTMALHIYDGRLEADQAYTVTLRIGVENGDSTQLDTLVIPNKNASRYELSIPNITWYSALEGAQAVSATVQKDGSEETYTASGSLTLENKEETDLTLSLWKKLYPVRFVFYSSQAADSNAMVLTAKWSESSNSETQMELQAAQGQFVFDGKLVKNTAVADSAIAEAYLPAGRYQFEIDTGLSNLGPSGGKFTLVDAVVTEEEGGTDIIVLNDTAVLREKLNLTNGDITFSDVGGQLNISYYRTDEEGAEVTTVTGQSYEQEYTIMTSEPTDHVVAINTAAGKEVKIALENIEINASGTADAVQINGTSQVMLDLKGENKITIPEVQNARAGIAVDWDAQLTIDSAENGKLEVTSNANYDSGAPIGSAPGKDAGTIIIRGGRVTATLTQRLSRASAIGSARAKSVKEIRIQGGIVSAEAKGTGAAIGTGWSYHENGTSGSIIIEGGIVDAKGSGGAGIGTGSGTNNSDNLTTINIHGGVITAGSSSSAPIGNCKTGGVVAVSIDGGTIRLERKYSYTGEWLSDIGTTDRSGSGETRVIIDGGTFYKVETDGNYTNYQTVKIITEINGEKGGPVNSAGDSVYYTTADVGSVYGKNANVENARIDTLSYNYGFKDVQTSEKSWIYIYLPEMQAAKATFDDVVYEGSVTNNPKNVLTREADRISVDIAWGSMEFTYSDGTWNPETYTYENVGWKPASEGGNKISVTNHSNVKILAAYHFTKTSDGENGVDSELATWFDGLSGKLTADADGSGAEVSEETLKAGTTGAGTGTSSSVYLNLFSEKPVREFNQLPLGTVTVQITKPAA